MLVAQMILSERQMLKQKKNSRKIIKLKLKSLGDKKDKKKQEQIHLMYSKHILIFLSVRHHSKKYFSIHKTFLLLSFPRFLIKEFSHDKPIQWRNLFLTLFLVFKDICMPHQENFDCVRNFHGSRIKMRLGNYLILVELKRIPQIVFWEF